MTKLADLSLDKNAPCVVRAQHLLYSMLQNREHKFVESEPHRVRRCCFRGGIKAATGQLQNVEVAKNFTELSRKNTAVLCSFANAWVLRSVLCPTSQQQRLTRYMNTAVFRWTTSVQGNGAWDSLPYCCAMLASLLVGSKKLASARVPFCTLRR